mmetsp:Transcript_16562/g.28715  ORF Transcript_16562/g.28715 Transcript_16562/m.28715 type:complete len:245 (-) Transcript_16562:503-1237(-)
MSPQVGQLRCGEGVVEGSRAAEGGAGGEPANGVGDALAKLNEALVHRAASRHEHHIRCAGKGDVDGGAEGAVDEVGDGGGLEANVRANCVEGFLQLRRSRAQLGGLGVLGGHPGAVQIDLPLQRLQLLPSFVRYRLGLPFRRELPEQRGDLPVHVGVFLGKTAPLILEHHLVRLLLDERALQLRRRILRGEGLRLERPKHAQVVVLLLLKLLDSVFQVAIIDLQPHPIDLLLLKFVFEFGNFVP